MTQIKKIALAGLACCLPMLVNGSETLDPVNEAAAAKAALAAQVEQITDPVAQRQLLIASQAAEDDGEGIIPPK